MLLEILNGDTVTAQLGIACQLVIFIDDLLRGATHLALWARAIKHPVYNITTTCGAIAVRFRPRT